MMKKALLRLSSLALAALTLVLTLTGCHGTKEQKSFVMPEEFDTSRDYEISFWAKNDTNMSQVNVYKNAIAEFESIYPNIKVNLRHFTNYGDIYNDVITNISTGTTPNVCITYPDHIATYISGDDTVVCLDDLLNHKEYGLGGSEVRFDSPSREEMIPEFLEECYLGVSCYALPFMRSTEACYINKTYVEALGYTLPETLTWDFIWEVSDAAAKKGEDGNFLINGQKVMIPFIYKSTDNMMIQLLAQQNAPYSTGKGDILIFNDTVKEHLYNISRHTAKGAFSTFKISSYPANFLNAGQCIFAIDSTAGASWMGPDAPNSDIHGNSKIDYEIEVMTIPQYDPEHPKMISQGPSLCIFNKEDPQEVLASWLFVQYLVSNDTQIAYAQTEGYVPVTSAAQDSDEYKDYLSRAGEDNDLYYDVKLEATKLLIENTENTFVTPVFNGSASLRDAAGQLIENVTKSTRRKETVDEAYMEKLYEEINALYRLDQIGEGGTLSGSGGDLGPLPSASVVLLSVLGGVWILIIGYFAKTALAEKKKSKKN